MSVALYSPKLIKELISLKVRKIFHSTTFNENFSWSFHHFMTFPLFLIVGLKKVTADMQTHKNPNLRSGPAPYKAPQQFKSVDSKPVPVVKPPSFYQDGKKWIIEFHKNNPNIVVQDAEMNNVVYMFKCENSTLTVKGKLNSIQVDSCKKCNIVFDSLVSSVEFVNCEKIQMQVSFSYHKWKLKDFLMIRECK